MRPKVLPYADFKKRCNRPSISQITAILLSRSTASCILRVLTIAAIPFFLAQSLAFVSFIYEESLQATGFACNAALMSEDQAIALDALKQFETVMKQAQRFQDNWGWVAFWAHNCYRTYFYKAAPTQLLGYYARGKSLGLWEDDIRRWRLIKSLDYYYWVDTWRSNPVQKLQLNGFDPDLILGEPYPDGRTDFSPARKANYRFGLAIAQKQPTWPSRAPRDPAK